MKERLSLIEGDTFIYLENKNRNQVGRLFFSLSSKNVVSLNRLYVIPLYRKQGLGVLLINKLIEKFPNNTILVDAYPDNKEYMSIEMLIEFYKPFGFIIQNRTEDGFLLKRN